MTKIKTMTPFRMFLAIVVGLLGILILDNEKHPLSLGFGAVCMLICLSLVIYEIGKDR